MIDPQPAQRTGGREIIRRHQGIFRLPAEIFVLYISIYGLHRKRRPTMSPSIHLPDVEYGRLFSFASGFDDGPGDVVRSLMDFAESHGYPDNGLSRRSSQQTTPNTRDVEEFDPVAPPDLTFTRLQRGQFGGVQVRKWNELLRTGLELAYEKLGSVEAVKSMSDARIVPEEKTDEGYKPVAGGAFSYPGVAAKDAWRLALQVAQGLGMSIEVDFVWRNKSGAAHPGSRGIMRWLPQDEN
jgi:hypothetical protein